MAPHSLLLDRTTAYRSSCLPSTEQTRTATVDITTGRPTMNDYFRPRRRKFGTLMLVITCLIAAGWVRSFFLREQINIRFDGSNLFVLESNAGQLKWKRSIYDALARGKKSPFRYNVEIANDALTRDRDYRGFGVLLWRRSGFEFERTYYDSSKRSISGLGIPYWSIVIPLTAICASLMLTTPSQKRPAPVSEDDRQ